MLVNARGAARTRREVERDDRVKARARKCVVACCGRALFVR
jgi:hypothetical protein